MTTVNIEDYHVYDTVNLSQQVGIAKSITMSFEYNSSNTATVKGFFKLMDDNGNVLRHGNRPVSTTGWTTDDSAIYNNFLALLNLTVKP